MSRYFLDTSTQYYSVDSAPIDDYPLTISAWFNFPDTTGDHTMLSLSDGGNSTSADYTLLKTNGANIQMVFRRGGDTADVKTAPASFSINTWTHAAGTYDGVNIAAFINGSGSPSSLIKSFATPLDRMGIGTLYRSGNIWYAKGTIAEISLYNAVISDEAIRLLSVGYSPKSSQLSAWRNHLVGYWKLDGDGNSARDTSPQHKYSMAQTNGPTLAGNPPIIQEFAPRVWMLAPSGTAPTAPSGLTATTASSSQIDCAWTDNSSDETGFELDYDTDSGFGSATTVTPAANATSYNVTGLSPSTLYYFRIRAVNGAGNSAYTATASDTTDAAASSSLLFFEPGMTGGLQTMSGGFQ